MASKKEKQGTIHELESQLANIEMLGEHHPKTSKQISKYKKIYNELKLFPKGADDKKKKEIIKNVKIMNFNEEEIIENQRILKALEAYNRIIEKERRKVEDEIRSGKSVAANDKILKGYEKKEINIPDKIRGELKIYDKDIRLVKYSLEPQKNKIKYASGQDYNFVIRNGFGRALIIPYKKLQKLREEGNVTEDLLKQFEKDVQLTYEKDKKKLEKSNKKEDRQKWKSKKKVYEKILNEVIEHNIQIATNKKYNKPFVKRDKKGNISDKDSRIPIMMDIDKEDIYLFIP